MECNFWKIVEAFEKMENAKWIVNSNLKWWFFFFHWTKKPLEKLYENLRLDGYFLENLDKTDDWRDWVLYISKIEVHNPKSLHERNLYFNKLAKANSIDLYDGWDVEPTKS